jgi:hypothetical protein
MSELRITYQIQLGEGQAIAYEIGEDASIPRKDLDELLDRIGSAADRRKAVFDLPFHQARLMSNLELLEKLRRELDNDNKRLSNAEIQKQANVVIGSRNRNREVPASPADVNAVAQYAQAVTNRENEILQVENTIKSDEIRIPYLQAIIAGDPPPDLFPEIKPHLMAAE